MHSMLVAPPAARRRSPRSAVVVDAVEQNKERNKSCIDSPLPSGSVVRVMAGAHRQATIFTG